MEKRRSRGRRNLHSIHETTSPGALPLSPIRVLQVSFFSFTGWLVQRNNNHSRCTFTISIINSSHSPNAVAAIQPRRAVGRIMQLASSRCHHHLVAASHGRGSHLDVLQGIALRQSAGCRVAVLQPHRIGTVVVLHLGVGLGVGQTAVHDLPRHSICHSGDREREGGGLELPFVILILIRFLTCTGMHSNRSLASVDYVTQRSPSAP